MEEASLFCKRNTVEFYLNLLIVGEQHSLMAREKTSLRWKCHSSEEDLAWGLLVGVWYGKQPSEEGVLARKGIWRNLKNLLLKEPQKQISWVLLQKARRISGMKLSHPVEMRQSPK
jgi:hypothetical protein